MALDSQETVFWQSIWSSANTSIIINVGQTSYIFTRLHFRWEPRTGIAYHLPNPEMSAENYKKLANSKTDLPFRSTKDVIEMAEMLGKIEET